MSSYERDPAWIAGNITAMHRRKTASRTIDIACRQCSEVVHVDFQDTLQSGDTLSFALTHRFRDEHDIQMFVNGVDVTH